MRIVAKPKFSICLNFSDPLAVFAKRNFGKRKPRMAIHKHAPHKNEILEYIYNSYFLLVLPSLEATGEEGLKSLEDIPSPPGFPILKNIPNFIYNSLACLCICTTVWYISHTVYINIILQGSTNKKITIVHVQGFR